MKSTGLILLLLLTAAAAPSSSSQTRPRRAEPQTSVTPTAANEPAPAGVAQEVGEDDVVRIETSLVTVPVSVMDRDGRYVTDLREEDFRVYENGVEQRVAYFAAVDKPFTVILTLDTSASTWSKLSKIREAALAFVEQLRPDDVVMVTSFARGFTVKCRPTTDLHAHRRRIAPAVQHRLLPGPAGARGREASNQGEGQPAGSGRARARRLRLQGGEDGRASDGQGERESARAARAAKEAL